MTKITRSLSMLACAAGVLFLANCATPKKADCDKCCDKGAAAKCDPKADKAKCCPHKGTDKCCSKVKKS